MKKKSEYPINSYITELANQAKALEKEYSEEPEQLPERIEAEAKPKPEAKSRRVQLLIRPSLYKKIQAAADREGMSVNSYMNMLMEEGMKSK